MILLRCMKVLHEKFEVPVLVFGKINLVFNYTICIVGFFLFVFIYEFARVFRIWFIFTQNLSISDRRRILSILSSLKGCPGLKAEFTKFSVGDLMTTTCVTMATHKYIEMNRFSLFSFRLNPYNEDCYLFTGIPLLSL